MKTLPSNLFPFCEFSPPRAGEFFDIVPQGGGGAVSLHLSRRTVKDDDAVAKAAAFFDRLHEWDKLCRKLFLAAEAGSAEHKMIAGYLGFYKTETPELFGVLGVAEPALQDMVACLRLCRMGSHEAGDEQYFEVAFTLGGERLLRVYFGCDSSFKQLTTDFVVGQIAAKAGKPFIYVDYNELLDSQTVMLSAKDIKNDFFGNPIELAEGLAVVGYQEDEEMNGTRDDIITEGVCTLNQGYATHVKWLLKANEKGIRYMSEITENGL